MLYLFYASHVCNGLVSSAEAACRMYSEICEAIATWQHQFDIDWNFCHILLPCPCYNFPQNVTPPQFTSLSVSGKD